MLTAYLRLCDTLAVAARAAIRILMIGMVTDVLLGVFFRYVVGDALSWTEEMARYLMIWMGFLGTGLALREGGHVAVELLSDRLPASGRRALLILVRLLGLGFLLTVVCAGTYLVARVYIQRTPVLGISMMWPYLAIPVGCLLTTLEMIALMLRDPDGRRPELLPSPGEGLI